MTILEKIINNKRKEVDALIKQTPFRELEKSRFFSRDTTSLRKYLLDPGKSGIIAEFKRMSPSKGVINPDAKVVEVTQGYELLGASALSVLTDEKFFGGSTGDLKSTREHNSIPVLRKDFIIDEFQVVESKSIGADVILLLASVLAQDQVLKFATLSHSLGMEVILEVHSKGELELMNDYIDIIGVNNRDLKTFIVDENVSVNMVDNIPGQFLKISESGISSPSTVDYLKQTGYNGFLIGEIFMTKQNPVKAFADFIKEIS